MDGLTQCKSVAVNRYDMKGLVRACMNCVDSLEKCHRIVFRGLGGELDIRPIVVTLGTGETRHQYACIFIRNSPSALMQDDLYAPNLGARWDLRLYK